jgi:calcium-translocating P-type ATPase
VYGANVFTPPRTTPLFVKFFRQLTTPLSLVLLVALLVTVWLAEYVDAAVIGLALLIASAVSLFQEGRASRAFATLAHSQTLTATVFRGGARHEVPAATLVPGDVVELQGGAQVPADLRLTKVKQLSINEAPLSGEWVAVEKHASPMPIGTSLTEQENMAFKGTFVSNGYGVGVVVATGDATVMGGIARELEDIADAATPLQVEMQRLSVLLLYGIGALIVVIFTVGIALGRSVHDMALMSIAVAVASIPEGLPAAVTIVLAVAMEALLRRGGLVRNLLAAETLGATTYVLTDKTGTLTQARMDVTALVSAVGTNAEPASWRSDSLVAELFSTALCATDAYLDSGEGKHIVRGEPMERAIVRAGLAIGLSPDQHSFRALRVDYLPFTSEQRFAAGLAEEGSAYRLCVNGAPHTILSAATTILTPDGVVPLTSTHRETLEAAMLTATGEGKRLLAVAFRPHDADTIPDVVDTLLSNLTFAGILICSDPIRPGVKEAIAGVRAAGAQVVLITGDHAETALAVARAVGIAGPHESALTGDDLKELSDTELLAVLSHVHVFARVLPRQKLRIAEVLQRSGEIVAMTGDGINDAPALQKANIGIALGSGTQVAKEASDLVLVKDSFATMYAAIEEGRRIVANLRKIVAYLLSTSMSEIALIGSALITGAATPILPVQILWANMIEEGLMSVAFAFEKGEKGAMRRRPQDIHEEGLLSTRMIGFLALVAAVLTSTTVALYFYLRSLGLSLEELRSAMFLSTAMDSLFIAFAFRSLSVPLWRINLFDNRFFIGAFLLSATLLFGALALPFMRDVLSYVPLPGSLVALVVGTSAFGLFVVELAKAVFFERQR